MNKKLLTLALSLSLVATASVKSFADDQDAGNTANQLQVNDSLNNNDLNSNNTSNNGDDTAFNNALNNNNLSDNTNNSNQDNVDVDNALNGNAVNSNNDLSNNSTNTSNDGNDTAVNDSLNNNALNSNNDSSVNTDSSLNIADSLNGNALNSNNDSSVNTDSHDNNSVNTDSHDNNSLNVADSLNGNALNSNNDNSVNTNVDVQVDVAIDSHDLSIDADNAAYATDNALVNQSNDNDGIVVFGQACDSTLVNGDQFNITGNGIIGDNNSYFQVGDVANSIVLAGAGLDAAGSISSVNFTGDAANNINGSVDNSTLNTSQVLVGGATNNNISGGYNSAP